MAVSGPVPPPPERGRVFRYESFQIDAERGLLTCRYSLDGREFTERVTLPPGPGWRAGPARAAARLVFLLAGVSYYKTAAPPVIDFGPTALTDAELAFLRAFYVHGLGEFAYRNALDLTSLRLEANRAAAGEPWCRSAAGSTRSWWPSGFAGSPTPRCSW
jgi:UDP-N-acetyl-alpha-D-muramoyl-L-alanyl-L-glutamate epimerase